jgi:predicted nucleotidyltransferase
MKEAIIYERLNLSEDELRDFCRRWQITEFALFGSILRSDFRPGSDVDVLVRFAPEARWSLLDHLRMEQELQAIFGREVDLVSRGALDRSENWVRRTGILSAAQPIYVSR